MLQTAVGGNSTEIQGGRFLCPEAQGKKKQLEYKGTSPRTLPNSEGTTETLSRSERLASDTVYAPLPP